MQRGKQTTPLGAQLRACATQRTADDNVSEQQTTSVLRSCGSVHGQTSSIKEKMQQSRKALTVTGDFQLQKC